VNNYKVQEGCW